MNKLLIGSIAIIVLAVAPSANAADMPVKAPPLTPPPATTFSWTGFYVGGNIGYGWEDPTVTFTSNDPAALAATCGGFDGSTCVPPNSFSAKSGLGGIQFGYNWQVNRNWLLGVETDFDGSRFSGTGTSNFLMLPLAPPGAPGGPANFVDTQNVNWFGTVRARVGFLPSDRLLVYGTGGFAYGRVSENVAVNAPFGTNVGAGAPGAFYAFGCDSPGGANCFLGSSSRITTGWAAGAGFEYALWQNLSLKAEYMYINLGGDHVNVVATTPVVPPNIPASFTAAFSRLDFNIVRVGLNWKFGAP
jgi:outer membrane immunogenic protein